MDSAIVSRRQIANESIDGILETRTDPKHHVGRVDVNGVARLFQTEQPAKKVASMPRPSKALHIQSRAVASFQLQKPSKT